MHAVLTAFGETPLEAVAEHLVLKPQERPVAGPGEVVLQVRACAVGWVDLLMSSGQYQHPAKPPFTPGLEFAGEVVEVGAGVERVHLGDAVLADGFATGPRSTGRYQRHGGFATWALLPEQAALPLPSPLSYAEAVNLLGNFETAYHVLVHRARLQPGETVLIHGASGSTGLAAVQLAKSLGATVIATGRSEAKLAEVKRHGADHVICTAAPEGVRRFRAEVKEHSRGGAHVVYDAVGGPITVESIRSMRFGGRLCIVGWTATPFVARGKGLRGSPNANHLPTNLIQMKGLDVLGCPAVIATKHDPTLRPLRLAWILDRVRAGVLRPHVGVSYRLDQVHEAMRAKWRSEHVGGCILEPRSHDQLEPAAL